MGIMTRRQGDDFVITSDLSTDASSAKRAPKRINDDYQVWTGTCWSASKAEAVAFASLDDADEYVRANFKQITS